MTPAMNRRRFLIQAFYASTAASMPLLLQGCGGGSSSSNGSATSLCSAGSEGEGELFIPEGPLAKISGLELDPSTGISVPNGFSIRTIATSGLPVTSGSGAPIPYIWHSFPDGGATYSRPDGGWIYTSNSEIPGATSGLGLGGCGAVSFDADGEVDGAYSILQGTAQNCAGGKTPWDTWVSCEEVGDGQCWETDPFGVESAVVKPALGKFAHEAIAVDPDNFVIYLTEDTGDGRFYRWVAAPSDIMPNGRMRMEDGTLEVMNIEGWENDCYPSEDGDVRELHRVSWLPVTSPDQAQSGVRSGLRDAGLTVPGTTFKGGEGLWYYKADEGDVPSGGNRETAGIVFFSTKGDNRIWAYDIENELIEIIFDNSQIEPDFNDVDNLTVSPWGDLICAEDNGEFQRLIVVLPNKEAKILAYAEHAASEFVGPAFSPDGTKLYFSSQRGGPLSAVGTGLGVTYELSINPSLIP